MPRPPPKGVRLNAREIRAIDELIKRGEFEGYSDFVHEAISLFLHYRETHGMMEILIGEGGAEILKEIIHKELQDRKQKP